MPESWLSSPLIVVIQSREREERGGEDIFLNSPTLTPYKCRSVSCPQCPEINIKDSSNDLFVPIPSASETLVLQQSRQDVFHFHLMETATQREKVWWRREKPRSHCFFNHSQFYDFYSENETMWELSWATLKCWCLNKTKKTDHLCFTSGHLGNL